MTQNYDQACARVPHRVFDAAQRMVVDQIASRANDEKVTQVLVEDQLRRNARIGASDDDGERMLRLGRLPRRAAVGLLWDTSLVANRRLPSLSLASAVSALTEAAG